MNFDLKNNGNFSIKFSEEELKIINNKKELLFDVISSKHIIQILMKICLDLNDKFPKETPNVRSTFDSPINAINHEDNK